MARLDLFVALLGAAALASCGSDSGEADVPRATSTAAPTNPATTAPTSPPTTPAAPEDEGPRVTRSSEVIGRSVEGRALRVRVVESPPARRDVLVVGSVHGDEPAGVTITRRLRRVTPPPGVALWILDLANPDGFRRETRQNARGVDLNRNFPFRWRPLSRGTFYSGPRPLSEPESRALHRFLGLLAPDVSIWYHQHAELVDASGGDPRIERRYARLVGLPYKKFIRPPGSITSWQNHTYPGDTAFVVELPAGPLSRSSARRHARAVLALAREGG